MGLPVDREQSNTLVSLWLKEVHTVMDGETAESQNVMQCGCAVGLLPCGSPPVFESEGSRSEEQGSYGCGNNEDGLREMTSVRQLNSIPEYVEHMGDGGKLLAGNHARATLEVSQAWGLETSSKQGQEERRKPFQGGSPSCCRAWKKLPSQDRLQPESDSASQQRAYK